MGGKSVSRWGKESPQAQVIQSLSNRRDKIAGKLAEVEKASRGSSSRRKRPALPSQK